jgi:peptidoglycan/LPS O-acetylase OafA/YrhL
LLAHGQRAAHHGKISYSVYLLHGLVLSGVFGIGPVKDFAMHSNGRYWLVIALRLAGSSRRFVELSVGRAPRNRSGKDARREDQGAIGPMSAVPAGAPTINRDCGG